MLQESPQVGSEGSPFSYFCSPEMGIQKHTVSKLGSSVATGTCIYLSTMNLPSLIILYVYVAKGIFTVQLGPFYLRIWDLWI